MKQPELCRSPSLTATLAALAVLAGCLNREEIIEVAANGSVVVSHKIQGDKADMDGGAARLPKGAPFEVERRTVRKEDGKTEELLLAQATFKRVDDMPRSFARAGDPMAHRGLRFENRLITKKVAGGTSYRFERRYTPRDWADYAAFWRRSFPKEIEELITDLDELADSSPETRRRVVHAILQFEELKLQHQVQRATAILIGATEQTTPTDAQLRIRAALRHHFAHDIAVEALVGILATRTDKEIAKAADALEQRALDVVVATSIKELGLDLAGRARLRKLLKEEQHDMDVSRDLEDENFTVRIRMPGRITGHNGVRIENGRVLFQFSGKDLRDRDIVLVVTSELKK